MRILVTGAAGFIGYHVSKMLVERGHSVVGLDNINDYYNIDLKFARIGELGIPRNKAMTAKNLITSDKFDGRFKFVRVDLEDKEYLNQLFQQEGFIAVCNLAAQAGVRYSLENPDAYINSNIIGFLNILENCRNHRVKHLVYASSSSVYGLNKKIPFSTSDPVDHPISLYAASKKSNELMAHTYSHLFGFATTGLRFFTVYGPWGRPDMALFLFTKAILKGAPIQIYNHGNMERDFTYIDDIAEGVVRILEKDITPRIEQNQKYKIYNIGNNNSVKLMDFVSAIEENLGMTAKKELLPMQPGDVAKTWADVDDLMDDYDFKPHTPIQIGIRNFIGWYKEFHKV